MNAAQQALSDAERIAVVRRHMERRLSDLRAASAYWESVSNFAEQGGVDGDIVELEAVWRLLFPDAPPRGADPAWVPGDGDPRPCPQCGHFPVDHIERPTGFIWCSICNSTKFGDAPNSAGPCR